MNYLAEINAFEKRMRRQPLPITAQLLWYKLMQFANRLYWPEWFTLENERLAEVMSTCSDKTVRIARDQLIEAGLIEFKRGVKKHPSQYHMVSLADAPADDDGIADYAEEVEDITTYFGYTQALGTELKKTTTELLRQYWPQHTPDANDERRVFHYIFETHKTPDGDTVMTFPRERKALLAYAFEQASSAGAVNWNYIQGIYRNFAARNIDTVDQAYAYDERRSQI